MQYITDLHIHSRYAYACSKALTLENIDQWCAWKGINIVSCGDFTHPAWFKEVYTKLKSVGNGLYQLKENSKGTYFLMGTEVSCIYKKHNKSRRIHILIFMPDIESVGKLNTYLDSIGNINSDGRPILGLDVEELTKRVIDINPDSFLIPAHAWTPWFAVFGSKSGFDSLEECFGKQTENIFAIETGLSSDPLMNWSLSALDDIALVSNSDAHSLPNLGREANVFELKEPSYFSIRDAIKNNDPKKFLYTIEFFPEEGKYHEDGHAVCKVRMTPEESTKHNGICPQCGKKLTIGVLNRVDKLSDRKLGKHRGKIPFKSIIPLQEVIAETLGRGKNTKGVQTIYTEMIKNIGNEFSILIDTPISDIKKRADERVAEAIKRMREGNVELVPGYDGIYGTIKLFRDKEALLDTKEIIVKNGSST